MIVLLLHFLLTWFLFQMKLTDADQLVLANQTQQMALGRFHEPFFYGQNYLFPLEAYLAAPLAALARWLGNHHPSFWVLKCCTALLAYLPFFSASAVCAGRNRHGAADGCVLIVLLLALLPSSWFVMQTMPRGFTGNEVLAFAALFVALVRPQAAPWLLVFLGGLFGFALGGYSGVVYMVCAVLLMADCRKILVFCSGAVIGFGVMLLVGSFYRAHPDYIVHPGFPVLTVSVQAFVAHLKRPDLLHEQLALLMPVVMVAAAPFFFELVRPGKEASGKFNSTHSAWYVAGLAALILEMAASLASPKIGDFYPGQVFFSGARFTGCLPYVALLFVVAQGMWSGTQAAALGRDAGESHGLHPAAMVVLLLFVGLSLLGRHGTAVAVLAEKSPKAASPVPVADTRELRQQCRALARRQGQDEYFLLSGRNDLLSYGCEPIAGARITQTFYERRTWVQRLWHQSGYQGKPLP